MTRSWPSTCVSSWHSTKATFLPGSWLAGGVSLEMVLSARRARGGDWLGGRWVAGWKGYGWLGGVQLDGKGAVGSVGRGKLAGDGGCFKVDRDGGLVG